MKRVLAAVALVVVALVPASASGVWGGALDTAHRQVGAMYFADTASPTIGDLICSGSYAGTSRSGLNDVFLLAGHCLPAPQDEIDAGDLYVSFDSNASSTDLSDSVIAPIQVVSYHQMPGFGHDRGDLRDLGILLLPLGSVNTSIPGPDVPPVQLAPAGYLDALKAAGTLNFRTVDLVGYGVIPIWDAKGPTGFLFDGKRRTGTSTVNGLGKGFLKLNQNRHGIGTGSGQCFGDSGSPQLDHGTLRVLSVTTGGNGQCNSYNINYRVDTPQAREFLGQFLTLP